MTEQERERYEAERDAGARRFDAGESPDLRHVWAQNELIQQYVYRQIDAVCATHQQCQARTAIGRYGINWRQVAIGTIPWAFAVGLALWAGMR